MTRCGGAIYYILAAMFLAGCSDQRRQVELDAHGCYTQEQRAIMICNTTTGECRVECREKNDE